MRTLRPLGNLHRDVLAIIVRDVVDHRSHDEDDFKKRFKKRELELKFCDICRIPFERDGEWDHWDPSTKMGLASHRGSTPWCWALHELESTRWICKKHKSSRKGRTPITPVQTDNLLPDHEVVEIIVRLDRAADLMKQDRAAQVLRLANA